ncbi:response regulator [Bdellovibrio sp. HCB337]|uniref:response regulator n=1 Tax=Bdellovibrio sp. HCB337 TaxID=3394358 RepID=UPI0039A4E99F
MIRTIICDDHSLFREGLSSLLKNYNDIGVIAEANNGFELKTTLEKIECDVLLTDFSMPGGGVELIKELHERYPNMAIIVLSMHSEDHFAIRVFKAGAVGFMSKNCLSENLADAIRKASQGQCFMNPKSTQLFESAQSQKNKKGEGHEGLSDREFEVMVGIADGRSLTEIGESLCLSVKTVSTYRSRVLSKLNLHSNAEIVHYVLSQGLSSKFAHDSGDISKKDV